MGIFMEGSQIYIGAPNGVVVCVDTYTGRNMQGRMYSAYRSSAVPFENVDELIYNMNALFDYLDFPREGTNIREFTEDQGKRRTAQPAVPQAVHEEIHIVREETDGEENDHADDAARVQAMNGGPASFVRKDRKRIMSDKDILEQHGYLETFIIRVQHRQNSTWQGRITWADENKTLNFRSIWEMIHLMESALNKNIDPDQLPDENVWEETEDK